MIFLISSSLKTNFKLCRSFCMSFRNDIHFLRNRKIRRFGFITEKELNCTILFLQEENERERRDRIIANFATKLNSILWLKQIKSMTQTLNIFLYLDQQINYGKRSYIHLNRTLVHDLRFRLILQMMS